MRRFKVSISSIEERTKFNNLRMFVLAIVLSVEQLVYSVFFSESGTEQSRAFLLTSVVSILYTVIITLIYFHNKKYDRLREEKNKTIRGFFLLKNIIQYSYLMFLIGVSIYRAVYISSFNFSVPVIYIAVLYGISFLFYYPPVWTAALYIISATSFIFLSKSVHADFLYDNFVQDIIVNNMLAWLGALLNYQRFGKQVGAINTIKAINKDKDELIHLRETIIDISGKVALEDKSDELYQYILEKCLDLVPNALYGSILMKNENGLLGIKAYVGFNDDEVGDFELPIEESFLYSVTNGAMDRTIIINRINGVLNAEKMVGVGEEQFPVKAEIASPLILDGKIVGIIGIDSNREDAFSDKDVFVMDYMTKQVAQVIRQQMLYDEVLQLSQYDSLTKLFNRNTFDRIGEEDMLLAKEKGRNVYFGIADLDGLKAVNDAYGHVAGDLMIQKFAKELRELLEPFGICARYGGDEFVFYTSRATEEEILRNVEMIKNNLDADFVKVGDIEFRVEFSFGISSSEEVGYSGERLYNHADRKMYEEKNKKRINRR